jgi:hypothetical protein
VQVVDASQPAALEAEAEFAGLLFEQLVCARVEDPHLPAPVLALGDRAFEGSIVERVVLDVNGQMGLALLGGEVLGHRPGHEDRLVAVLHLESEVEVQAASVVLVDDEAVAGRRGR